MKIGVAVILLGVFVLLSGLYVVITAPWEYMEFDTGGSYYSDYYYEELFRPFTRTFGWISSTFLALVVNLFISGIALIFIGYALYRMPEPPSPFAVTPDFPIRTVKTTPSVQRIPKKSRVDSTDREKERIKGLIEKLERRFLTGEISEETYLSLKKNLEEKYDRLLENEEG